MKISNKQIDGGKAFDWGRVSADYAKYRDIYPAVFYEKIAARNLCTNGQQVLDLGTGTGVLPRNMYPYGARWTGVDISEQQIAEARQMALALGQDISFQALPAEELDFPEHSYDVVTACQCFWYFDHKKLLPKLAHLLKQGGRLLVLYMAWLPLEDPIAAASERLVLQYSPHWSGANETMHPIEAPACMWEWFEAEHREEYRVDVPFTRESWNGRMKACRGVGASLTPEETAAWEAEHKKLLEEIAPEHFTIRHYAAMLVCRRKEQP
ncbi:MAG: class I SAM-dependent methyltransferase [Lachnospiraceae bacterium]|nr:class I SAM-dependent methyltransferase [Lachnospiraceae bacterium]